MRIERFVRVVGSRRPRRHWMRVGAMVVIAGLGCSLPVGFEVLEVWPLVVVIVAGVVVWWVQGTVDGLGEVITLGGLRWGHRGKGVIEVELLGGGRSWREDLRRLAVQLLMVGDDGWRSYEVVIVTAVFPARWMCRWGFDVRLCGAWRAWAYRLVYWISWRLWSREARRRGERAPRWRERRCVEGRHRMGPWMDVVRALPAGLR